MGYHPYYWDSSINYNEQPISSCSTQGMVAVNSPASDVNFTHPLLDHTVNFNLVDSNGATLSDLSGGTSCRPKTSSNKYYSCGYWTDYGNGAISKKLPSQTEMCYEPYTWGGSTYDPASSETCFTTGASGASSTVNITMTAVDAKIHGSFVDEAGSAVQPDSSYVSVYATRDSLWRSCTVSGSSYTCNLSAGKWCLGCWLDWNSGYKCLGSGSRCVDVTAGGTVTQDMSILKTGAIKGVVKDNNGNPLKWVWVEADTTSAENIDGTDDPYHMYGGNGSSTNSLGEYTANVAATCNGSGTTYYLTAHKPWSELNNDNLTLPEEVSVTVKCGETVTADPLVFRVLDGTMEVAATAEASVTDSANDVISNAYITCFSDMAGYAEATTDSAGKATVKCASSDLWHCVGVNQLDNNCYISEAADATCIPGSVDLNIKLNSAGTIPDSVTQTLDCSSATSVTLTDNFSLVVPSGALGESGTCTLTVSPDLVIPYKSGKRPAGRTCSYGYDITLKDSSGNEVTQLNSNVTLCIPFSDARLALEAQSASELSLAYRDTSTDAYVELTNVTIDDTNNTICGQTNHFTEFAIVGNGSLKAVDGDSETATEEADRTGETATGAAGAAGCGGCYALGNPRQIDDRLIWMILLILFGLRRRLRNFFVPIPKPEVPFGYYSSKRRRVP